MNHHEGLFLVMGVYLWVARTARCLVRAVRRRFLLRVIGMRNSFTVDGESKKAPVALQSRSIFSANQKSGCSLIASWNDKLAFSKKELPMI